MPKDWTHFLTEGERETLAIARHQHYRAEMCPEHNGSYAPITELNYQVEHVVRSLAASRALVAEKDKALREWIESNHTSEVARIALALKEEEMME
mgnify:CR=1 FL=1